MAFWVNGYIPVQFEEVYIMGLTKNQAGRKFQFTLRSLVLVVSLAGPCVLVAPYAYRFIRPDDPRSNRCYVGPVRYDPYSPESQRRAAAALEAAAREAEQR